jgi:hypothetical protein
MARDDQLDERLFEVPELILRFLGQLRRSVHAERGRVNRTTSESKISDENEFKQHRNVTRSLDKF